MKKISIDKVKNWEFYYLLCLIGLVGIFRSNFWNEHLLNIDEMVYTHMLQRVKEFSMPFAGVETFTSGPVLVYFLSIIHFFTDYPSLTAIRIFQFFCTIVPSFFLLYYASEKPARLFAVSFFFFFLITFSYPQQVRIGSQFGIYDDYLSFNTEYVLMLEIGLMYYLQAVCRPSKGVIFIFSLLLWLSFFTKSQAVLLVGYFCIKFANDVIKQRLKSFGFYVFVNSILGLSLIGFLIITGTFSSFYIQYIQKNFLYADLSTFGSFYPSIVFIIKSHEIHWLVFLLVGGYFFKKHFGQLQERLLQRKFLDPLLLWLVTLLTLYVSKNHYFHYKVLLFFPMSLVFGQLCQVFTTKKREVLFSICFLMGLSNLLLFFGCYNQVKNYFLHKIKEPVAGIAPLSIDDAQIGQAEKKQVVAYLQSKYKPGDHLLIFGQVIALGMYYELLKSYQPAWRSANSAHLEDYVARKDWVKYEQEEGALLYDLSQTPPRFIVDTDQFVEMWLTKGLRRYFYARYQLVLKTKKITVWELK